MTVGRAVSSRVKSASSKIERVLLMIRKLAANTVRITGRRRSGLIISCWVIT